MQACACGEKTHAKGKCAACYKRAWEREYYRKNHSRWADRVLRSSKLSAKLGVYAPLAATKEDLLLLREVFETEIQACYCCGKKISFANYHEAVIDHCHKTGKLRGVVCIKCNYRIGLLDNGIKDPAQYLQDFG